MAATTMIILLAVMVQTQSRNDRIDLSAFDFDDFGDLNIVEQNNSVFIFIDENTSIELSNTDADELSADDFVL